MQDSASTACCCTSCAAMPHDARRAVRHEQRDLDARDRRGREPRGPGADQAARQPERDPAQREAARGRRTRAGTSSRVITYGHHRRWTSQRVEETFPGVSSAWSRSAQIPKRGARRRARAQSARARDASDLHRRHGTTSIWEGRFITPAGRARAQGQRVRARAPRSRASSVPVRVARSDKRIKIGSDYFTVIGTLAPRMPPRRRRAATSGRRRHGRDLHPVRDRTEAGTASSR